MTKANEVATEVLRIQCVYLATLCKYGITSSGLLSVRK